jgi:HAD superfamily hydrolase (TIGR01490 family)
MRMTGVMEPTPPAKTLIAIYDMDKTITRRATYNGFLGHVVRRRQMWRVLFIPALPVGLLLYALKIWSRGRLKEFSQTLFIGKRADWRKLSPLTETYADSVWQDNVYPQLAARVAAEKALGYTHVIATASYLIYTAAIGARLDFHHFIATELELDTNGYICANIQGENCYGTAKLDRVQSWLAEQGLKREDCNIRAYSDHISDVPLLAFADEAFATNPHPPLARLAKQRGWEVIDWR